MIDRIDFGAQVFDKIKDWYYGVVEVDSLFNTDIKFVNPYSPSRFLEFKGGKLYNWNGEITVLKINKKDRSISGVRMFGEYKMKSTLGFDKRCTYIDMYKSYLTFFQGTGY